ncbi:MAG: hypothetical protein IPM70_18815 [Proteobacteria bacterium]|nr:hypothetical protein [Pseudomonadota bacterium]
MDLRGIVLLRLVVALIGLLGGHDWNAKRLTGRASTRLALLQEPRARAIATLLVLALLAQPAISSLLPQPAASAIAMVRSQSLSAKDAALKHRGYYEQLDARNQLVGTRRNHG